MLEFTKATHMKEEKIKKKSKFTVISITILQWVNN